MDVARKVSERCLQCNRDSDVWIQEKQEGSGIKKCYTCNSCGYEWSEMIPYSKLDR
ncbi:hypothetical protein SAMN06265347_110126 [Halobellus salinus]|nr:hypothetical protein SAMN06265347_110126 [Halobellus salinus]